MKDRLDVYRRAGLKAVEYQLGFQLPDGGYIWDGYVNNAYHKQAYSWQLAGRFSEAHRLMNWAKKNTLQSDGQLKDYLGDVYKMTWFFLGAHRMGRFDLSYPVMSYLLSSQAPCGGFPRFAGDELSRALTTSWMGISLLYFGNLDAAVKGAECCVNLLDQQPEEGRFYFHMTGDGKLVTDKEHPKAEFIDFAKPKQKYYEAGIPMMLMCKLYQTTGDSSYLEHARRFFELHLRCYKDSFAHVGSGKSALAAAIYFLLTGDERARDAAYRFCDFLVETQLPDGSWYDETEPDELLYYVDHAAGFNVWLQEIVATLESAEYKLQADSNRNNLQSTQQHLQEKNS